MDHNFQCFEEQQLGKHLDFKILKRLFPLIKPYKLYLSYSILLIIAITFFDLSLPYIYKITIDHYIIPITVSKISNNDTDSNRKYYKININDDNRARIVKKYGSLFEIKGSHALILPENLSKVKKTDIAILRQKDIAGILKYTFLFLAMLSASLILTYIQVVIMEYTGQMIMHELRMQLMTHIQNLPVVFFDHNPVGRLVTRVTNDIQNMNELFTSIITFLFKDVFLLAGIMIVLIGLSFKLALLSFSVLPFVLFASIYFAKKARNIFRVLRIKIAQINTSFSETIGGVNVLQLFCQEKESYLNFSKLNHENYIASIKMINIFAFFMPLIELIGAATLAIVIYYGGKNVISDTISLGVLVAFIYYIKMYFRPIRDIAEKYNILQNAFSSAERIFQIMDYNEKDNYIDYNFDSKPPFTSYNTQKTKSHSITDVSEIEFKNVCFAYIKNEYVLKKISFKIKAGESIAIVGQTGSGKTSLINLLLGFYAPGSGQILINGKDINKCDISSFRSKISTVMQDPFLFSDTMRNNIFPQHTFISKEQKNNILRNSNCQQLIDRLPDGIDTVMSEAGSSISSGERQLISIAKAFARNPQLIIFDEATSYIDSETEHIIQEAFLNLAANTTSIVIAHRLSTARLADKIIVINSGEIIETGNHDELISKKGFYFRLTQLI